MEPSYTQAQIRRLKSLAQTLPARVIVGKEGLSPAFLHVVSAALTREELIKVRLGAQTDRAAKAALAEDLAKQTDSFLVTRVGHVAVLYRPAKPPKIILS
jgi:RNA-binding protein